MRVQPRFLPPNWASQNPETCFAGVAGFADHFSLSLYSQGSGCNNFMIGVGYEKKTATGGDCFFMDTDAFFLLCSGPGLADFRFFLGEFTRRFSHGGCCCHGDKHGQSCDQ